MPSPYDRQKTVNARPDRITFEHRSGDKLKGFEWTHLGGLWVRVTPGLDGTFTIHALHTPVFDALLPNLRLRWGDKVLAIKSCEKVPRSQMMVIQAVEER